MTVVGRGAMVQDHRPRQRRTRKLPFLWVTRPAREGDPVAHLPGGGRERRIDGGDGRAVANAYRERLIEGVRRPLSVAHLEPHVVVALGGVSVGRIRQCGVVVSPVAVEIPLVREGVPIRVAGAGAVE